MTWYRMISTFREWKLLYIVWTFVRAPQLIIMLSLLFISNIITCVYFDSTNYIWYPTKSFIKFYLITHSAPLTSQINVRVAKRRQRASFHYDHSLISRTRFRHSTLQATHHHHPLLQYLPTKHLQQHQHNTLYKTTISAFHVEHENHFITSPWQHHSWNQTRPNHQPLRLWAVGEVLVGVHAWRPSSRFAGAVGDGGLQIASTVAQWRQVQAHIGHFHRL